MASPMPIPEPRQQALVDRYHQREPVLVTRPTLPPLHRMMEVLERVWETRWLTNRGELHARLEEALAQHLGLPHLSLVSSGTMGLLLGLRALGITSGEVITTPFSFPASAHVVAWSGLQLVFADIDPVTGTLDPACVARCITPETRAILPVHVHGQPCDVEGLAALARRHGLRLLYDGAHAFGVRSHGSPLARWGDLTVLSFHATKPYSTGEGGAVACCSPDLKQEVDRLANHYILDEETVAGVGLNAKLSELHCAYGLLRLEQVEVELQHRALVAGRYREGLTDIPGLELPPLLPHVEPNHSFFPIRVRAAHYGVDRDQLHLLLRRCNVGTRKYFHPLLSSIPPYRELPTAAPGRLPVAETVAREVLCLPMHGTLGQETVQEVCALLQAVHHEAVGASGA